MIDVPEWLAIPRPEEIYHEPVHDGPCSCDTPRLAVSPQVVYTLHFDPRYEPYPGAPAYKCAGHYTGKAFEHRLPQRLLEHEEGRGARITQVQREAGGTWRLASVEPGGADRERQLKQHSAARRCPICKAEAEAATSARWQQATSPHPGPQVQPEPQPEPRIPPELDAELEPG
jgi:predicted GIY-YIG superfamily endonuclease